MWDAIVELWQSFIPPLDATPQAQYNWRVRVGVFTCAGFTLACGMYAIAYGFGEPIGVSGFERTVDSQRQAAAIIAEIRSNRAEALQNELLNLRIKHCAAVKAKQEDAKIRYWAEIERRMVTYQELTKQVYPLPACTDL